MVTSALAGEAVPSSMRMAGARIKGGQIIGATDAVSFATAAALLTAVALFGTYLPARRASRFDPLVALRQP